MISKSSKLKKEKRKMSETSEKEISLPETAHPSTVTTPTTPAESYQSSALPTNTTTPTSSVTGAPTSRLKAPTHFGGSSSSLSKIGRLCSHTAPKTGPPPRGMYII